MTFVIWITGLPGSGKSTIAKKLLKLLKDNKISIKYLRLDKFRKKIVPNPKYTEEERDFVYRKLGDYAIELSKNNNVLIDATAHKKLYRDYVRKKVNNFIEVYIKCPLDICIKRETNRKESLVMARIYKKALERKMHRKKFDGLGQVIGVDVPFEENKSSEIIINSNEVKPLDAAKRIFRKLNVLLSK